MTFMIAYLLQYYTLIVFNGEVEIQQLSKDNHTLTKVFFLRSWAIL